MQASDIIGSDKLYNDILPMLVEVKLKQDTIRSEVFSCIVESLTRIGVRGLPRDNGKPTLLQTCNILHKKGKYYICHFKSLFLLDGGVNTITSSDIARQNTIIQLLVDWGMIEVVNPGMIKSPVCSLKTIKVIKYGEIKDWNLVQKYKIGQNKEVNV